MILKYEQNVFISDSYYDLVTATAACSHAS